MDIPKKKLSLLEKFFRNIPQDTVENYIKYWDKQTAKTPRQRWEKWIFAATSIHTGWENNVAQFNAMKDVKGSNRWNAQPKSQTNSIHMQHQSI